MIYPEHIHVLGAKTRPRTWFSVENSSKMHTFQYDCSYFHWKCGPSHRLWSISGADFWLESSGSYRNDKYVSDYQTIISAKRHRSRHSCPAANWPGFGTDALRECSMPSAPRTWFLAKSVINTRFERRILLSAVSVSARGTLSNGWRDPYLQLIKCIDCWRRFA